MAENKFSRLFQKLKRKFQKEKFSSQTKVHSGARHKKTRPSKRKNLDTQNIVLKVFDPKNRAFWHKSFIILLIILISYIFGKMTANKLIFMTSAKKNLPLSSLSSSTHSNIQKNLNQIKTTNLFNTIDPARKEIKPQKKEKDSLCFSSDKKSLLPLKIKDTIVLQNNLKSMAFISISGKPPQGFREGDKILNMVRLDSIKRLTIYFKNLRNFQCEYVTNIKEKVHKKSFRIIPPEVGKKLIDENLKKHIRNEGNKFFIKKDLREKMLGNIDKVLTQARAIQIKNPDGSLSFKMTEIEPGSIYSLLNLMDGDIITGINGKPIENLNEILSMFGKIKEIDNLSLTLKREGEEETKEYSFEN